MLYEVLKKQEVFKTANNFCDMIGIKPQSLTEIKANRQLVTTEIILKFLTKFNQFTADDIFNSKIKEHPSILREPLVDYVKSCKFCDEKERIIKSKEEVIEALKEANLQLKERLKFYEESTQSNGGKKTA